MQYTAGMDERLDHGVCSHCGACPRCDGPCEPVVRRVIVNICEPCIRAEGQECHTPSCILYLHRVDIPLMEELMEDASNYIARE